MYSSRPNLHIGFYGCDEGVRNKLVNNPDEVRKSEKPFDWLGNGFYIWENNYDRALQWAQDKRSQDCVTVPAVLGVPT